MRAPKGPKVPCMHTQCMPTDRRKADYIMLLPDKVMCTHQRDMKASPLRLTSLAMASAQ